ncbi:MAG: GGDEF domain-containing protein [Desulfamplus sp.]|nr:GGDEF domain-containing protein [Desulfamplus sp.]
MSETDRRTTYIEKKKINALVDSLYSSMPATVINALIIAVVLWEVVPVQNITIWVLINTLFVLIRYGGLYLYRKGFKENDLRFWKTMLLLSFGIAGIIFGICGFILVNPHHPEYTVFIYFVCGGMLAGSLGSYHNHLPVFFTYSIGVFILPTIAIYTIRGAITTPMALLGIVFFMLLSLRARKMNQDLSDALSLRYDNNQLVINLNREKKHTEQLNARLMAKNHELQSLTRIDPLTQLKNRRYLFEVCAPAISKDMNALALEKSGFNRRAASPAHIECSGYGIFMMDIDKFKRVNDNYGHDSGDMILKQFSAIITKRVRDDDVVARLGGEEFLIILKNTKEKHLDRFAESLRMEIEKSIFHIADGRNISITSSMGYIFHPLFPAFPMEMNFDQIISLADKGLYHAKESGRNLCVKVVCNKSYTDDPDVAKTLASDTRRAMEKGDIYFRICAPSPETLLKKRNTGAKKPSGTKKISGTKKNIRDKISARD